MNLKNISIVMVWLSAWTLSAQVGNYLGPGLLNGGAGGIGTRSGKEVDLRLFGSVSGIYDNNVQPTFVDSSGHVTQQNSLYGLEAAVGVYGVHKWKTVTLGLDYRGAFRHYEGRTGLDGSDHTFSLGLTYQKSRRMIFNFRETAGSVTNGIGNLYGVLPTTGDSQVTQPTAILFDNRFTYTQTSGDVTYLPTARIIVTLGGNVYLMRRESASLVGMNGYGFTGTVQRRLSRGSTAGVTYQFNHFDYPGAFGGSDIHRVEGFYATALGRRWAFSAHGGMYLSEVTGVQEVQLNPLYAALFGRPSVLQAFYVRNSFPSGNVTLTRTFQEASFNLSYSRSVAPGNGIYLTSRTEGLSGVYSYTGLRKLSMSVGGGYSSLSSLGISLPLYFQLNGGASITYRIAGALHLNASYSALHQEIDSSGYRRTGSRAAIGLAFSPGSIPLSLW